MEIEDMVESRIFDLLDSDPGSWCLKSEENIYNKIRQIDEFQQIEDTILRESINRWVELNPHKPSRSAIEFNICSSVKFKQEIQQQIVREERAFKLLPEWNLQLYPNTLTLFAAPTGVGKTLLTCHMSINALSQGKRVVYLQNEQRASFIYRQLCELETLYNLNIDDLIEKGMLLIYDHYNLPGLQDYRQVARIIEKFNACDLLIYDQLNKAVNGEETFKAIPFITGQIENIINGEKDSPAIVVTQQALEFRGKSKFTPDDLGDGMYLLRGSKDTLKSCTHALMYQRIGQQYCLKITKFRGTTNKSLKVAKLAVNVIIDPETGGFGIDDIMTDSWSV